MSAHRTDVAFIIGDLSAGGSQRVLQRISSDLAARGHALAVITLSDGSNDFFPLDPRIRRIALGRQKPSENFVASVLENLRTISHLRRELSSLAPRTVCSFIGVTNILAIAASALLPFRIVVCERNNPDQQTLGFPWQALRRSTYRWASLVTANSMEALMALSRYVPRNKLFLLRNPLPMSNQRTSGRSPTVLAVGRLSPQKGFDVLIDAWSGVQAPGWQLDIVGAGSELRALQQQAMNLGIADRIRILEPVADVMALYQAASILAAPSRFEGTPNVVLEASIAALPAVISQGCGDALEIIQDEVSGRVVPIGDAAALREALQALVDQPELRQRYGERARSRVAAMHDHYLDSWIQALHLPAA